MTEPRISEEKIPIEFVTGNNNTSMCDNNTLCFTNSVTQWKGGEILVVSGMIAERRHASELCE
jgi:hypothetical protein